MTDQPDDSAAPGAPDRAAASEPAAAAEPRTASGSAVVPTDATGDATGDSSGLVGALEVLRARLGALRLPLETSGVETARTDQRRATDQLDDYLLPRLRAQKAPLLVVVGGSTGAGKSTLVNSVLGEMVTQPGVLRPTTKAPVLVHHPLDARWFSTDRVLPGMARLTTSGAAGTAPPSDGGTPSEPSRTLRLVPSDALPKGLALLDAPDIDSVDTVNRDLAAQLLGAADLWLFVTTSARYADAVPWDLLLQAAGRKAQVAMVLDRVDPGAEATADDLRDMMVEQGLAESALFVIPEAELVDGMLPEEAVSDVSRWLTGLGGDAEARGRVIAATRDGVVDSLVERAAALADAADEQQAADVRLRHAVDRAYADAVAHVAAATSDGALLRGEVLARWQDFVGTGEFFRAIEEGIGRFRDAVAGFFRGKPKEAPQVEQAIAHGLESVVLDAAEDAAERSYQAWRGDAAGAALLEGLELSRTPAALRAEVAGQIRGWQGDVLELVREQGAAKRGTARVLSLGVNGLGVALMIFVFASTGGLTGIEVGIAGGSAVLAQRLLEAVFGEDAVRGLAMQARDRLRARIQAVMDGQAARYTAQLDALGSAESGGAGLRSAAAAVASAASAERRGRARAADVGPDTGTGTVTEDLTEGRGLRGVRARPAGGNLAKGRSDIPEEPARKGFWKRLFGEGDR
ncbi:dynamin family protein [Promicromonospora iranensis]|uniref:Energy-coupling factor transporter ATP-binding protein EcfA2 n=1 Tax=Promicromonospora iranensis TaxID=1105144 RepID=A0ABU2CKQ0_9MICO|nr:dynamin family protein [Promicromonospora iranensis]MDR7381888.1 energy-coupling factor transporter ATP-binding protein EcfA2 [Promicromonospora iranensis]